MASLMASRFTLIESAGSLLLNLYIFILIVFSGFFFYDALFYAPLNTDAGTFLPLAYRLSHGLLPVRDINFGYTPLAFLIFSLPYYLVGSYVPYIYFIGTILALHVLCALLVYSILRRIHCTRSLGLFGGLAYIASMSLHEGSYIFLEPFVNFFSLCSLFFFFGHKGRRWSFLATGFCGLLAFLCKQYGMAVIVGLVVSLVVSREKIVVKGERIGLILSGFVLPLVTGIGIYCLLVHLDIGTFVLDFYPKGYIKSTITFPDIRTFLLWYHPFLFLFPLLFMNVNEEERQVVCALGCVALFFAMPLFVRQYLHYFQLIIPYVIILGVLALQKFNTHSSFLILMLLLFMPLISSAFMRPLWKEIQPDERKYLDQGYVKKKLWAEWSAHERVTIFGDPKFYHMLQYFPTNDRVPGYGFLSNFPVEKIKDFLRTGSKLLIDREGGSYYNDERARLESAYGDFPSFLGSLGYTVRATIDSRYELWEKFSKEDTANVSTTH